jgi:hypothetical protein
MPVLIVIGLFCAAWFLARASGVVARTVLTWHDRRNADPEFGQTKIATIKRRETLVASPAASGSWTGSSPTCCAPAQARP